MKSERPNVEELARSLVNAFPKLDETEKRVALATYRRLARGVPASPEEIARDAGSDAEKVREILGGWPGVFTDDAHRVIGFWGLAIPKMKHGFEVDGVRLFTWCAWDTLFLPELLGKTARVESACETSGELVRLTVSPARVESAEPAAPWISFLTPDVWRIQQNVIQNFCHYVHFFRSSEDGEAWIAKTPGTFLLTLEDAFDLARQKNRLQFGAVLQ